jgi:hypothetical protein
MSKNNEFFQGGPERQVPTTRETSDAIPTEDKKTSILSCNRDHRRGCPHVTPIVGMDSICDLTEGYEICNRPY